MENGLMKNEINEFKNSVKTLQSSIDKLTDLISKVCGPICDDTDEKVKQAYDMFVKKEDEPSMESIAFDGECPVDEKVFGEEKSVDDCTILNLIPETSKKWVDRLTIDEMIKVYNDLVNLGMNNFENDDAFVSEFVDHIKDMAIAKYTNDLLVGRISKIEDEEIKSEVIDYMKCKKMPIPNSLLPKECIFDKNLKETETVSIKDLIERLDQGEVLELPNDILTKIIDQLWDTRDNISIEVRNNKIRIK